MEAARAGAYQGLTEQVRSLLEVQHLLRGETANLVNALRRPNVRGRWGEIQLRRVVELAGMLDHCDFTEQTSVVIVEDGGRLRPDLLVRLPAGKTVVVDAKVPIDAFFDAARSIHEAERTTLLQRHANEHPRPCRDPHAQGVLGTVPTRAGVRGTLSAGRELSFPPRWSTIRR